MQATRYEIEVESELQKELDKITQECTTALGDNLVSLVLYGSHARGDAHEFSDINLLLVVKDASSAALTKLQAVVPAWMELGARPPVIFSEKGFSRSFDSFALEFAEMATARKVLKGSDPFASFHPDWHAIRRELEHEARQKRIDLQRRWLASGGQTQLYKGIISDTLHGYLTLIRGTLLLQRERLEVLTFDVVFEELKQWAWYRSDVWKKLREFAQGKLALQEEQQRSLVDDYLEQARALEKYLDGMNVNDEV